MSAGRRVGRRHAERLDDLGLAGPDHERVLDELEWLNRWLGNHRAVAFAVRRAVRARGLTAVRVVDVGCGSGDVLAAIGRVLRADGIAATLTGIDGNPATVALAAQRHPEATFARAELVADAVGAEPFAVPPCDLVVTSQFLYHLDDDAAVACLRRWVDAAGDVVVSELTRSRLAAALFRGLGWAARLRPETVDDGVRALGRSWTARELDGLLARVGAPYTLRAPAPFRRIARITSPALTSPRGPRSP